MKLVLLTVLAAGVALLAGCVTGPVMMQDSTKYTIEDTERFVLVDQPSEAYVACTGLQEQTQSDGRLVVVADVKNREKQGIRVQVECVFKDAQGSPSDQRVPWRTLLLPEDSTEAVRFVAESPVAKRYTIRVRRIP